MKNVFKEFHTSIENSKVEKEAAKNNSPVKVKVKTTGPTYVFTKDKLTFIMSGLLLSAVVSLLVLILIPSISSFTAQYLVVNLGLFIGLLLNLFKNPDLNNLVLLVAAIFFAIILFVYSITMFCFIINVFILKKEQLTKVFFIKQVLSFETTLSLLFYSQE
jgi:uncharacterized protein YacL